VKATLLHYHHAASAAVPGVTVLSAGNLDAPTALRNAS
jgi:hypothetical protein